MVCFLFDEFEASGFVDVSGCGEDVVSPQHHVLVAGASGEFDAFMDQALAQALPSDGGVHIEQAQFGGGVVLSNDEDGADNFIATHSYPTFFAAGYKFFAELANDFCQQGFKANVPAVFFGVQQALLVDDPSVIARYRVTQGDGWKAGYFGR